MHSVPFLCPILFYFKIKYAEGIAAVSGEWNKTNLADTPIHRVTYEALMAVVDLNRFYNGAVLVDSLDTVCADQGFRKLEFGLYQRIVAGHVVIIAVEIAIKDQTDLADDILAVKGIANAVSRLADPQILLAAVTSVAHDVRVALRELRQR